MTKMMRLLIPLAFFVVLSLAITVQRAFGLDHFGADAEPAYGTTAIWTDPDTRCDYIVVHAYGRGGFAITPRMNADGTQKCDG